MTRVAVLQFPGINSEVETLRALWDAGIEAVEFRWNQDPTELQNFDGFVIPGGFSYEDRGRAGLIASKDPVMREMIRQANSGKPVLGICNGAQILVESGLIPGGEGEPLLMCLARNKRVKNGEVLGTGFYNENVFVRCEEPSRTAFTLDYEGGELEQAPVAHGEGRFTTIIPGLLETLRTNHQIVFRYCTAGGEIQSDFPVNPNGAMDNAAAICNPAGNVMAIMPHPERSVVAPMPKIFSSMRKYMEERPAHPQFQLGQALPALQLSDSQPAPPLHTHRPNTIEFFVKLLITDNEAQTLENALKQLGYPARLSKWVHFEVEHEPGRDQKEHAQKILATGEFLNPNKEQVSVVTDTDQNPLLRQGRHFLVRDKEDPVGLGKTAKLQHELGSAQIKSVKKGWFWRVEGMEEADILASNILANHHAQDLWRSE